MSSNTPEDDTKVHQYEQYPDKYDWKRGRIDQEVYRVRRELENSNQNSADRRGENVRLLIALAVLGFAGSLYIQNPNSFPILESILNEYIPRWVWRSYIFLLIFYLFVKIFISMEYPLEQGTKLYSFNRFLSIIVHIPVVAAPLLSLLWLALPTFPELSTTLITTIVSGILLLSVIASIVTVFYSMRYLDDEKTIEAQMKTMRSAKGNAPLGGGYSLSLPELGVQSGMCYLDDDREWQARYSNIVDEMIDSKEVPLERKEESSELFVPDLSEADKYVKKKQRQLKLKQLI